MGSGGGLALVFAAISERLDRIEERLGIVEPTPSQAELETLADGEAEE